MIKGIQNNKSFLGMVVAITVVLGLGFTAVIADFDGNGRADVFVVVGGRVHRYEATGQPGGLEFVPETLTAGASSVAVGNIDNDPDGKLDLLIGRYASDGKPGAQWWEPLGGKSLWMVRCKFGSNVQANGVAICSEPDGSSDLYLRRGGRISKYGCGSDNEFNSAEHGITSGVQCLAGGNINHDSGYDLLVGKQSRLTWYQSQCGKLTAKQHFDDMGNLTAMVIGDLDGDVHPDIVAVVDVNGINAIKWFEASGKDTVALTEVDISLKNNSGFSGIAIGDVDGDGVGELLATQSCGPVRWFVSDGNDSIKELTVAPFAADATSIAIASSDPTATWPGKTHAPCCVNVGDESTIKVGQDAKKIRIVESGVVTASKEDLNFPQFRISQAGEYAVAYGTGHHGTDAWYWLVSGDSGKSWHSRKPSELPGLLATLEMDGGKTISMGYTTSNTDEPEVKTINVTHSSENWKINNTVESTVTFPFEIEGFAFVRSMIPSADGTAIYAAGHRAARGGGAMMLESRDAGLTWHHKSTIIAKSDEWMGRAGPSETAIVRLTNGNLLAVMRTGGMSLPLVDPPAKCPMAYSISTDDGATWGEPVNMQCPGVLPDMAVLKNGTVIMLSGRPGVYVRLATPDGMTWSEPFYIYEGTGCANSSMQLDSDGMPVIVYTESDVCGHEYPGYTNYIKMVKLQIDG